MKAPDNILYNEKNYWKKMALVMTVPCNIFPMMLAVAGLLNIPDGPMLFPCDVILYGLLGSLYIAGLWISFRRHKKVLPLLLLIIIIAAIIYYTCYQPSGMAVVMAIMATMACSVSNQYYRAYTVSCSACNY